MRALRGWTVAMAARHYGCFKTSELYAETVKMVNFMLCVFYHKKKKKRCVFKSVLIQLLSPPSPRKATPFCLVMTYIVR